MAAPLLPQDVTEHLATAIRLSDSRVHLRFLEEADTLLSLQYPAAAIVVAGVVLEFLAGQHSEAAANDLQEIGKWTQLRDTFIFMGES
jgi:hypothetical protein